MGTNKKILLSGIKPTGKQHMGNYIGAMRQYADLQNDYQSFVFIADYHALTTLHNPDELRINTLAIALDYLAVGLDPNKTTMYVQSDVPEVTELAWIFNCVMTMPYLMRAHAFKDAEAKNKDITVGVFDYPILMAADILIQDADIVPVGEDQRQHLEIARDMARKFNNMFGETFKIPEPYIIGDKESVVPGIDGRKMSKSYGNIIPLFGTDDEIRKTIASIVTDSKGATEKKDPGACNVFALHEIFSKYEIEDIGKRYREGTISYKESKDMLANNMIALISPMREKRNAMAGNIEEVARILKNGGEIARSRARIKLQEIRDRVGFSR